jgi:pyruvate dehydrogenase E2 component (dihydrolipoamide acetyltransferase)
VFQKTLKKDLEVNVSVNDIVIKSAALALRDVNEVNAKWNKSTSAAEIIPNVDISVAVATPNGLITPIVTKASKRGIEGINKTVKDLATRARDNKLKPEEYQGGSFSISNLGMFGISQFSAVINPPQACILAVGAGVKKVVPPNKPDGKPRLSTTVTVQLSADRRVVDEALAAQFLQVFKSYISKPKNIVL